MDHRNFEDDPSKQQSTGARDGGSGDKNPFNYNILKGGKVDPRSKLYQRSIAGREQLKEYLSRLWNDGGDESDVFMAGVKSLMNRGHGYVGAYLDSKNPGRRYNQNQAMAIVDQVMEDESIGSHPGNRLTRAKDEDEKQARKEANKGRGFGPKQAPGKKAMPVGQQRKEGKRESTGQPLEGSRREGVASSGLDAKSEWLNTLKKRVKGEASTSDVLSAFQKQYQSKLSQSPTETAKREEKKEGKKEELRQNISGAGKPAPEKPGAENEPEDIDTDTQGKMPADPVIIGDKFKELVQDTIKAKMPIDKNSLESMIQETIEILEDDYDVDPEQARAAIFRRFNGKLIDGQKIAFDPSSAPEQKPAQESKAPEPAAKSSAPVDRQTQTADQEVLKKATLLGKPKSKQEEAAPEEQAPAPEAQKRPAPSDKGFKAPPQQSKGGGVGFTPGKKEQVKEIAKSASSPEELKKTLGQLGLFGKEGFKTGSSDNPLEEAADPYAKWRGEPGEERATGGQPPEAEKAGAEGQQSAFRKGTTTPRDFRNAGKNVKNKGPAAPKEEASAPAAQQASTPEESKKPAEKTSQVPLKLGGDATQTKMKQQQNTQGRREAKQVKEINAKASPGSKLSKFEQDQESGQWSRKQSGKKSAPPEQQELDLNKPAPEPEAKKPQESKPSPASPQLERAKAMKELMDQGLTSAQALKQLQKQGAVTPRAAKKRPVLDAIARNVFGVRNPGTTSSSEYQQFADSIKALMR